MSIDKVALNKQYFLLPHAAHGHNQSVVDTQYKILLDYVSLLTLDR